MDLLDRCGDCPMTRYPVCACQVDRAHRDSPALEARSRFFSSVYAGWPGKAAAIPARRAGMRVEFPRLRDGRVRVGLAMPAVYLGGVESWALTLARLLDPARVAWVGTAVAEEHAHDATAAGWLEEAGAVRYGPGAIGALAAACDVLICWGTGPPAPRPCKVLLVSHGQGRWTRNLLECAGSCEALAAVSDAAKRAFPDDQQHRVKVIPNCVDPERLLPRSLNWNATRSRWGVGTEAKVALYLGRISTEKRPMAFIDTIANLPEPWVGVMIGNGKPDAEAVARKRIAWSCPGRVVMAGPTDDVGGVIRGADIGVVCSAEEGCCLAMLEMMYLGLPVVSTPVGHAPEMEGLITIVRPMAEGHELAGAVRATMAVDLDERLAAARAHVARVNGPEPFGRAWSDLIVRTAKPRLAKGHKQR